MLPKGWKKVTLSEIAKFSSGGTPSKDNLSYWQGDIPWISASSMRGIYYNSSELKITLDGLKAGSKLAKKNALLLLVRGSMLWNKIPIGIATRDVAFNQDVKAITPQDKVDPYFLLYWFLSKENKLLGMVVGTGIGAGKLDTDQLLSMELFLPTLQEQQKIAAILKTWDEAIALVEQLIEKKQKYKKALMRRLLTGKLRFAEFKHENWYETPLARLCHIKKGEQLNRSVLTETGEFPALNGGITPSGYTDKWNTESNTITISEGGNSCGYVSLNPTKFWCGGHCYALLGVKIETEFLYHKLKDAESEIMKLRVGSGLPNIQKKDLERFVVMIPNSLQEQRKMATIFSKIDRESKILEMLVIKLKNQKQGLMQQLLTGIIRV